MCLPSPLFSLEWEEHSASAGGPEAGRGRVAPPRNGKWGCSWESQVPLSPGNTAKGPLLSPSENSPHCPGDSALDLSSLHPRVLPGRPVCLLGAG